MWYTFMTKTFDSLCVDVVCAGSMLNLLLDIDYCQYRSWDNLPLSLIVAVSGVRCTVVWCMTVVRIELCGGSEKPAGFSGGLISA